MPLHCLKLLGDDVTEAAEGLADSAVTIRNRYKSLKGVLII
jgi:hypothetical protein